MSGDRVYLYDTTLRDGAQTQGVDFSAEDKAGIAIELDRLGVDYVEAGWPGANPTDDAFFAAPPKLAPRQACRLRHDAPRRALGRERSRAAGGAGRRDAASVTLVGKTWDFHVDVALEVSLDGESSG